jgi:Tfp pilus assembly protein PilN
MRPVNLIPSDERRGGRSSNRSGPVPYVVIGALVAILAGVTAVVMTGNSIAESKAEIERLEQEEAAARAHADSLRAFADFSSSQTERTATVTSLAQSRFDWSRVLQELAVVVPPGITLKNVTGTVNPAVSLQDAAEVGLRDDIAGPALTMTGCAAGQEAVAALVAALEDIDGVTRVGLESSERSEEETSGGTDGCYNGFRFAIAAAFDEVVVPAAAPPTAEPAAPAAPAGETATPPSSAPAESTVTSNGG